MMEINYWVVGIVLLVVIAGLVLFFRRNQKDEKSFVDEIQNSELKPEESDTDGANKDNLL